MDDATKSALHPIRSTLKANEPDADAVRLAEENEKSVQEMFARFTRAGEPVPPVAYNSQGQVIYAATKKEIEDLMRGLHRQRSPVTDASPRDDSERARAPEGLFHSALQVLAESTAN
jgi:hypothetical protein